MSGPEKDFAECLKELLVQKKVSASELARMMAYKSRNSIFRILDGEGAHGARLAFFSRLKEENPLALSAEEIACLEEALEISRVGLKAYRSNAAIRQLLAGDDGEKASVRVMSWDGGDAMPMLSRILAAPKVEIVVTGCCDRKLLSAMRGRLSMRKNPGMSLMHIICTAQEELAHVVNAIQPLLFTDFYTAYCVEPGTLSKAKEQIYRANSVLLRWEDERGKSWAQPYVLADGDLFCALRPVEAKDSEALLAQFAGDVQKMTKLKAAFSPDGEPDYVAYTDICRRLEQGRAIYTVKLDVPFSFISADILVPCALESFEAAGIKREAAMQMVEPLREVHVKRFENIFHKNRPTHTVFSRAYMERFARTGRQTDHFFAFRPYTGAERAAILTHIRDQARDNPNFCVHFFKDGFEPPQTEIGLYEGVGTLMTKPFTDYNLAGDHTETFIASGEFCARYKAFFTEDLLTRQVMGPEETLAVLDELIEMAKEA